MSNETLTEAIENDAASTNPYIRGLCDDMCDHLLMLAEVYQSQAIDRELENKFPGYAKGDHEASEIFGICADALSAMIDTLTEVEDGSQGVPQPRRFGIDDELTTPGSIARAHTHHLLTTRDYVGRFSMTEEETRSMDVRECKQRMTDATELYREMQYEARDLCENYLELLHRAGYDGDVFADDVRSSLPSGLRMPRVEQAQEDDAISSGVDERY
ncbi:hypothetical protein M436DRAFT_86192 [Aureobasidium namibiae CBS 147.97]|uniref:Uncharacterized protein n=1 Tax=Aureobasidium namibiae CBS 147.97 TaxID=1043004 RepID=A0A074W6A1_9PEZI